VDAVLKWIGIVGAAWLLLSILTAVAWALVGKRIFRKPPQMSQREAEGLAEIVRLDAELRGRAGER
jgi:hypothetical protein